MATEQILRLTSKELASGLRPDLPGDVCPMWKDGENVDFAEGALQPAPGQSIFLNRQQAGRVAGMLEVRAGSGNYPTLFWAIQVGTTGYIYRYNSLDEIDQVYASFTGQDDQSTTNFATTYSFARWGTWVLVGNGRNASRIWKPDASPGAGGGGGTPTFAALGGGDFTTCEVFVPFRNFMLAFNTSNGQDYVQNSDEDDPEIWTPSSTNAARRTKVRDLPGYIVSALAYRDYIAFFTASSMHAFEWIGAPDYFRERPLLRDIGVVGKNAVVVARNLVYGFSSKGIFSTDGVQYKFIDTDAVHDYIYDNINRAQISKVAAVHDKLNGRVIFYFPYGSSTVNNKGVSWRYQTETWSILDHGRTCGTQADIFDNALLGGTDGLVLLASSSTISPAGEAEPVPLTASATLTLPEGFGEGGFGDGFFGGTETVSG